MKIAVFVLSTMALLAASAHAGVLGFVQTPQGRIEMHDERGPCTGNAMRADFVPYDGDRVSGCWVVRGTVVAVVFLDGDIAQVPVVFLQKPSPA